MTARVRVIAWILAGAAHASAEPRVTIRAPGTCPSAAAIERALPPRVHSGPHGELLVVEEVEGGAVVHMTTADGPIDAHLESRDCAVLAAAVAAVADAWFVELPKAPPEPLDAPAEQLDVPASRVSPRWNLAVARALVVDPSTASASAATQIDLGWWTSWRDVRLTARFALGGESALATTEAMNTATRQTWGVWLTLGRRVGHHRFWFEGAGGAAAVLCRVDGATQQQRGEVFRAQGAVAATAAAGVRLGAGASLRLDLGALLYPVRDRYTIPPVTVARSPIADLAAGIGLEVALGERFW